MFVKCEHECLNLWTLLWGLRNVNQKKYSNTKMNRNNHQVFMHTHKRGHHQLQQQLELNLSVKVAKPSPRMKSQLVMLLLIGIFSSVWPLMLRLWLWYALESIFVPIWNWLGNDWVSRAAAVQEQMHYHVFHYLGLSCCSTFRWHFWCIIVGVSQSLMRKRLMFSCAD